MRCLTQFSLSLDEIEQHREKLRPWRSLNDASAPRLCIDVRLRTSALAPDQVLVGCAPHGSGTRIVELGDANTRNIVLERWIVDMRYVCA